MPLGGHFYTAANTITETAEELDDIFTWQC